MYVSRIVKLGLITNEQDLFLQRSGARINLWHHPKRCFLNNEYLWFWFYIFSWWNIGELLILLMIDILPPPGIYKQPVNNGINYHYLSTCAGFLPSTVWHFPCKLSLNYPFDRMHLNGRWVCCQLETPRLVERDDIGRWDDFLLKMFHFVHVVFTWYYIHQYCNIVCIYKL